jgi:signal peptidase I
MQPTLYPDESGLVNKLKLGARIFNIHDAINGKPYSINRLPGYGHLQRGDIIIFNYPYADTDKKRDSIVMNLATYYCKRAVAIPGDTLEIRDCYYHIKGQSQIYGVKSQQEKLRRYIRLFSQECLDKKLWPGWMKCAPKDSTLNWTIQDMGPILIPGKNITIDMNYKHWLIYRRYVEWETHKKLIWKDSIAYLDGKPLKNYTFAEDYCFAAGDNVIDSKDSRYFGLVPQKFIVGTASIIWSSSDIKRIFKKL